MPTFHGGSNGPKDQGTSPKPITDYVEYYSIRPRDSVSIQVRDADAVARFRVIERPGMHENYFDFKPFDYYLIPGFWEWTAEELGGKITAAKVRSAKSTNPTTVTVII